MGYIYAPWCAASLPVWSSCSSRPRSSHRRRGGYYVFADGGGARIERLALGPSGYLIEQSGAYDQFLPAARLSEVVRARDPKRIGVNMSGCW